MTPQPHQTPAEMGKELLALISRTGFDVAAVRRLIRRGADLGMRDENGSTPILFAVISRNVALVKEMAEAGASVKMQNNAGNNALIMAAGFGTPDMVRLLLKYENDLGLKDNGGRDALENAQMMEKYENEIILRAAFNAHADAQAARRLYHSRGLPVTKPVRPLPRQHRSRRR